jgi:hypothetical protein
MITSLATSQNCKKKLLGREQFFLPYKKQRILFLVKFCHLATKKRGGGVPGL